MTWRNGPLTVHGQTPDGERVAVEVGLTDARGITIRVGDQAAVLNPWVAVEYVLNIRHFIGTYMHE